MKTPQILDQLIGITGIRDLEMLEVSLLNTLWELIRPVALSIEKFDLKDKPVSRLTHTADGVVLEQEGLTAIPAHLAAMEAMQAAPDHTDCFTQTECPITVYRLIETTYDRGFLFIQTEKPLSSQDTHFLSGVLGIYRNFCSLLQHAQTDELTGLNNRKTFDEYLGKIQRISALEPDRIHNDNRKPAAHRFWLAIADIDFFKSINDRFGHLYGDEVLVLFAQILRNSFRTEDMMFRFGGEEFVVILRCPDQSSCRDAIERFRSRIEERLFPQVGIVTVSIGVVELDPMAFSATQLDFADKALYHSKQQGRNRVTFFEDMVSQGLASKHDIQEGEISLF